jgi:hypothetical protein
VKCEIKSDTGINRGDWIHFKITQTVPEQHTGKAGNWGTAANSHIGHCTLTAGSADVKVQNILNMGINITCSTNCKYRTAATLCTVETWFVSSVYNCKYCINMITNNYNDDDDDDNNNNNNNDNSRPVALCAVVQYDIPRSKSRFLVTACILLIFHSKCSLCSAERTSICRKQFARVFCP